jgi:hypothetical protein
MVIVSTPVNGMIEFQVRSVSDDGLILISIGWPQKQEDQVSEYFCEVAISGQRAYLPSRGATPLGALENAAKFIQKMLLDKDGNSLVIW